MSASFPLACLVVLTSIPLFAQVSPDVDKYHQMLQKRPQAGVIYERFYGAWLETGTADELAAFLTKQASAANSTPADHLILATFHEQQGDETAALTAFKAALGKDAANSSAWVQRAKLEARVLDFAAGLSSLAEAEKDKPSSDLAREIGTLRGRWLLRTGKPEPALQAWRDLLQKNADDEDLAEEVIELQLDEGLYGEAEAQMTALVARTTDAYDKTLRQLRLAEIMMRGGKKEDALKAITDTLAATGQGSWIEGEVLTQLEAIFRKEENLTGLSTRLAELSKAHPQRVAVQRAQARVLAELGEKDQALALFASILEKTPGERELRESYLDLLERFEKFKEGIEQTNVLLTQSPTDRELLIRLATLQERAKDSAAAKATVDKYLAAKETTEFDHLRAARLYESWERAEDATAAYEAMVKAFPDSAAAKEAHAHYLHRTGKKDAAITIWTALAKDGDLTQVLAVGQALMSRGEAAAALTVLKARATEFNQSERFLGLLVNAALADKKDADAATWALARVRATQDLQLLDDPVRQVVVATEHEGRREQTIADLKKLLTPSPAERILLAALLEESGDLAGSEKALREMPAEHALAAQGRVLRLMERRQDWLRAYEEAQKLAAMPDGRTSNNVQRLAELAERNGKGDEALKHIADWKTLAPSSTQPWLSEARLMRLNGKMRESLQLLRAAARKFDDDEAVVGALAAAYSELGQMADAERIYLARFEEAEQPEDKMRWVASIASMANERGQLKALAEKFEERQRTNRNDAGPWLALAEIHRIGQNPVEQERALREALRLRPDDVNLAQQLARIDLDMGQWKRALETLERVATKDKGTRIRQMMASIQIEYGDANAGYRQLYEIAGGDKMDADDAVTLVKSMTAKQDWERAVAFLEPQIRLHSLDYRLGYLLAVCLEEKGRTDEATRLLTRLLLQKEERPGAKKTAASSQASALLAYYTRMEKTLPPGVVEFYKSNMNGYGYQAYRYRQAQRYRSYGPGNSPAVSEPTSLEMLRSYGVPHLVVSINDMPEDQAKAAWTTAKSAGVPHTDILSAAKPDQYGQLQFPSDEEPMSDVLMAVRLSSNYGRGVHSMEFSTKAYERFKDSYPGLALQAAIAICQADLPKGLTALEPMLTKLMELPPELSSNFGWQLQSMMGGSQSMEYGRDKLDLPPAIRDKCMALVMRTLDNMDPMITNGARSTAAPTLLNACRHQQAWDTFVTLLEREIKLYKEHAATAKSWATYASQFSQRNPPTTALTPLPFPHHSALPAPLSLYFRRKDLYNPRQDEKCEPEPEDYKEIAKRMDKITHPLLRAVVAFKAEDEVTALKEITQRLEAKDSNVDDLLMAASWHGMKGEHAKAAELLVKASSQDISATTRPAVDSALAHAVTSLAKAAKPEWLEPAQMALRRLRSARITAEQKDELVTAMKAVGLAEEADQWAKLASVAPSTQTTTRSYSSNNSSPDTTKLKQLLGTKEEEAIAREAVTQIKRCISYAANGNQSYAASRAKEIMRLINKPGLKDKVNAAFAVKEDGASTKLLEYASFLDLTAQKAEAAAVLEKLLARDANQHEARLRLCTLVAAKEPERAVALLKAVPVSTFQRSGLGDQITSLLNDDDLMPFNGRMTFFSTLAVLLDSVPVGNGSVQGLEWMIDLPGILADNTYNTPRLPHLSWKPGQDDGNDDPFVDDKSPEALRRLEVMEQICRAFLKHPQFATEAFRWQAMLALKSGKPTDEIAALATQALTTAKGARTKMPLNRRYSYYQEQAGRWAPTPAEFLVWQAWKKNQPDEVEKEVLPLATAALDSQSLALLRAQKDLLFSSPEDFAAKAKALLTLSNRSNSSEATVIWLTDRWAERDVPGTPLDPLVLEQYRVGNGNFSDAQDLVHYLTTRAKVRPEADEKAFGHALTQTFLGKDPASWPKSLESTLQARYGRGGSYSNQKAYTYTGLVSNLLRQPDGIAIGMHLATISGQTEHSGWASSNSYRITSAAKNKARAVSAFRAMGWLGEAGSLQVESSSTGLRHRVLREAGTANASTKADVRPQLLALKPQTFGTELVAAFLSDNPAPDLSSLLKRRAADLAKVPESSRAGLATLIKSKIPALSTPATADQALVTALKPLLAEELKKTDAELEKWMAATSSAAVDNDDDAYDEKVQSTLANLVLTDPDKATRFFLKASELMEAKTKSKGWQGNYSGNGWSNRSSYVDNLLPKVNKPEAIGWAMKVWHEDTSGYLSCDGWSNNGGMGQPLMEIWRNNGGNGAMGRGIDPMFKRVSEVMGDTPHTLLPLAFFDFVSKLPTVMRQSAMRYAAKVAPTHPHTALARELDYAARLYLSADPLARNDTNMQKALAEVGGMAPVWEHYRAKLADTKLNARVRQALGHHLIYQAREHTDPACIRLAAAAALESQKAKHCLHGYQYGWIIYGFNHLPVDDQWKAQAQEHWDAWVSRNAQGGLNQYSPYDWAINSVLRMVARSGNEEWARKMLSQFHSTMSNEASGIASLVMGGMPKLAAEHFAAEWRGFLVNTQKELNWCQEIQDGFAAFGEESPDPATAFLGQLYLASLKDPTKPEQDAIKGFKNKKTRVKELASRFKDIAFTDPEMRRDAVAVICLEWDAAQLIPDVVKEVAAKTDFDDLATQTNTWEHWQQLKPFQVAIGLQAAAGELKPAMDAYDKALSATCDQEYYHRSLVEETGWGPIAYTPLQWTEEFKAGKPSKTKELLPFLDHVLAKTPANLRDSHIADAVSLKWLIHLVHQDEAGFENWRKALKPADAKAFYDKVSGRWEIWKMLKRHCVPEDNKPRLKAADRLPLVTALLKHEWTQKRYPGTGPGIPNLITHLCPDAKVFKTDELVEVAKDLANALPRVGRTAGEAADFLANNGKPEPAVALYALAAEHARKENEKDYSLAAGFVLKQAEVLERTNKRPEAQKLLQALDPKRLGPGNKKNVEAALQRLSTTANK